MGDIINVYCDESCHLENDGQKAMVFGAVWCPAATTQNLSARLNDIRAGHGMPRSFEFKWTKISPSKQSMYLELVDAFFEDKDLRFRCLVIPDKQKIDHSKFDQTHDDWYYKMYFNMLKVILKPHDQYRIYLDIKDTKSKDKVRKLHDVLCNNAFDFSQEVISRVQQIRSHETAHSQLADILIGAISYKSRGLVGNTAKVAVIERIAQRSGYTLEKSTLYKEEKLNIFVWQGADD